MFQNSRCRFVLSLLAMMLVAMMLVAMMIAPLCYSSTLIDRHHPDGRKVRIEINDEKTRNNTLTLTGGQLAGNADFPSVGNGGNGGFFYLPPPWGGGRPSGLFEMDLTLLQPVINWLMSTDKSRQASNEDGQPSGSRPTGSNDATNQHQQEEGETPENRENQSPGESFDGSEDGNNRKDDNGSQSNNNASTQDLQALANQLIAIIEGDDPNAVVKFKEMLDKLNMPQRLQVLETQCTKIGGSTITPLEAILALPRSFHEGSIRNQFIWQVIIVATDKNRMMVSPDNSYQMILYNIVLDIIHKVNQSHQQPPIGYFEKRCFTEYFVQLFLHYSHPVERIRNLLGQISDLAIRNEIINDAQSLKSRNSFLDTLKLYNLHPSFHELIRLSNELRLQNDYIAINAYSVIAMRVVEEKSTHIVNAECQVCKEQFVRSPMVIVKTPCNHLCHVDCFNRWLKKRDHDNSIRNSPTYRAKLNALRKNINDFNNLLRKYKGCHSLAIAERAFKEWNKAETNYATLYHFIQFCRHSSPKPYGSQFVKLLRCLIHPVTKAEFRHDGVITSATFSANNHLVVTASRDGTVKIYGDAIDGSWKEEFTIRHPFAIPSASFSADSSRVLTVSDDKIAKIHARKEDGSWQKEITTYHYGLIRSASFSTDSSRVLTLSEYETATIHVLKEGGSWKEEGTISHDFPIHLASFSADGSHVVTADLDNVVKITGKSADGSWQVKIIVSHKHRVNSAIFSPDNRYVLTASDDGTANIIARKDDESWEEELTISHIRTHGQIRSAAFSPDSRHVLTVGKDNLVKIIGKRADGSWGVKAIISHSARINSATFSPDSRHVMTTSDDKQVKIYGEKTDALWEEEITIHHDGLSSAIFSPDSQHAVIIDDDGMAILNYENDGSWKKGLPDYQFYDFTAASFSADSRFLMTLGDGIVKIKSLNGAFQHTIRHLCSITSASFSANSRFVLTKSPDGPGSTVKITELWKEE
ncbi:hypothetical protein [Endozoicomonas sp. 4G]|uniref:hypothetical protein n=1 Tax=Endozoicomonas sp. 4G TaxID=2872754 RepID=UPI002078A022|nr:hypothetical protein [Endozoicomonas sp. 4G]